MTRRTLLVVVVILTALCAAAVVSVVSVDRMTTRSQRTVCAADAHMIRTAVANDRAQRGQADAPTMAALVERGFLAGPSPYHAIAHSGRTLALRGLGACAGADGG